VSLRANNSQHVYGSAIGATLSGGREIVLRNGVTFGTTLSLKGANEYIFAGGTAVSSGGTLTVYGSRCRPDRRGLKIAVARHFMTPAALLALTDLTVNSRALFKIGLCSSDNV
jgi:autotransporter passenger strand-loop-strand repeat protein